MADCVRECACVCARVFGNASRNYALQTPPRRTADSGGIACRISPHFLWPHFVFAFYINCSRQKREIEIERGEREGDAGGAVEMLQLLICGQYTNTLSILPSSCFVCLFSFFLFFW